MPAVENGLFLSEQGILSDKSRATDAGALADLIMDYCSFRATLPSGFAHLISSLISCQVSPSYSTYISQGPSADPSGPYGSLASPSEGT